MCPGPPPLLYIHIVCLYTKSAAAAAAMHILHSIRGSTNGNSVALRAKRRTRTTSAGSCGRAAADNNNKRSERTNGQIDCCCRVRNTTTEIGKSAADPMSTQKSGCTDADLANSPLPLRNKRPTDRRREAAAVTEKKLHHSIVLPIPLVLCPSAAALHVHNPLFLPIPNIPHPERENPFFPTTDTRSCDSIENPSTHSPRHPPKGRCTAYDAGLVLDQNIRIFVQLCVAEGNKWTFLFALRERRGGGMHITIERVFCLRICGT